LAAHVTQAKISDAELGMLVKCSLGAIHSLKLVADLAIAPPCRLGLGLPEKGANQRKAVVFQSTTVQYLF
jgi:hypothetical protein